MRDRRNHNSTRVAHASDHHSQLCVCDNRTMLLHVPVLDDVSCVSVNVSSNLTYTYSSRDKYMTAFLTFLILGHVGEVLQCHTLADSSSLDCMRPHNGRLYFCPHRHRPVCRTRSYNVRSLSLKTWSTNDVPRRAAAATCAGTDILIAASLAWALGSIDTHYSSTKMFFFLLVSVHRAR